MCFVKYCNHSGIMCTVKWYDQRGGYHCVKTSGAAWVTSGFSSWMVSLVDVLLQATQLLFAKT